MAYNPHSNPDAFTIERRIARLSEKNTVVTALTVTSFGELKGRYDLRRWKINSDGQEIFAFRGLQLSLDELRNLRKALNELPELKEGGDQ